MRVEKIVSIVVILSVCFLNSQNIYAAISGGTTYQTWSFSNASKDNVAPDSFSAPPNNTFDPYLYVNTTYTYDSTAGAWPLGELDVFVPNYQDNSSNTEKQITIQLSWKGAANNYMPPQPLIGVVPDFDGNPSDYKISEITRNDLDPTNGWNNTTFSLTILPNPLEEWIAIKGDIIVNTLTVNTYCGPSSIPEPCTIALLGLGAIFGLKGKSKLKA